MYRQQRKALVRLEQGMEAAMQRVLTKRKALAILYGRHLRFYMTKTQVCSQIMETSYKRVCRLQ